MKTEPYENNQGEFRCFGFPNALLGKEGVREILSRLSGLEIEYLDKSYGADVFCQFYYKGNSFHVSEPYGDNSYYDIVCEQPNTKGLEEIYNLFVSASVPTRKQWIRAAKLLACLCFIVLSITIYSALKSH